MAEEAERYNRESQREQLLSEVLEGPDVERGRKLLGDLSERAKLAGETISDGRWDQNGTTLALHRST